MSRKTRKSRLFVGSSRESLSFAYAVQDNLDPHDAYVKVWPQGVFNIGEYGLESLLETVKSHDFAVFIFAPDDETTIRHQKHRTTRDNVVFELGLFMGALGRERTFVFFPNGVNLHLPSDLFGWNVANYDPDPDRDDPTSAVGSACNKVRNAIRRLGPFRPGAPTRGVSSVAEPIQAPPPFSRVKTTRSAARQVIVGPKSKSKPAVRKGSEKGSLRRTSGR